MYRTAFVVLASAFCAFSADVAPIGKVYDTQLSTMEREFVPAVEAMPADKFDFKPSQGAFSNVRTFSEQAKHAAAVLYLVSAAILEEKPPVDTGGESGPATAKTKEQVVQFVKDAFVYAHKAAQSLSADNEMSQVKSPFGDGQMPRAALGSILLWHSFDHYGQMAVYLRMNGIIPPASR